MSFFAPFKVQASVISLVITLRVFQFQTFDCSYNVDICHEVFVLLIQFSGAIVHIVFQDLCSTGQNI